MVVDSGKSACELGFLCGYCFVGKLMQVCLTVSKIGIGAGVVLHE